MTFAPWTPERVVDAAEARALIESAGWDLALARVEPFGHGFDNTAFLVDDAWVVRFPRRRVAAPLLVTEAALLPWLAPQVPLPVPVPCLVGQPSERFPWAFTGYRRLAGRTACSADLTDAQRLAAAAPLARFLAALHALPADEARARGAGGDAFAKLDVGPRVLKARGDLAAAHERGLLDAATLERFEPIFADLTTLGPRPPAALVHGDLYAQHVLVDDVAAPAGVIDWGDVHVGDRALDLAFAWLFLPPAAHAAFRAAYGPIDDDTWKLARFRAVCHAAIDLVYTSEVGEHDLLREIRRAVAWLIADIT